MWSWRRWWRWRAATGRAGETSPHRPVTRSPRRALLNPRQAHGVRDDAAAEGGLARLIGEHHLEAGGEVMGAEVHPLGGRHDLAGPLYHRLGRRVPAGDLIRRARRTRHA